MELDDEHFRIYSNLQSRRVSDVTRTVTSCICEETGPRLARSLTLAAMSLGYVVVQLDVTIVNVAINTIGASLGGSLADLQWIVNAYTITLASFILTAGALGDRIGAKRVFVLGFLIFVACLARLRAGADFIGAHCRSVVSGHRRRDPGAEFAGIAQSRLSERGGTPSRRRHLGRGRKLFADRGAAARRRADRARRLAKHIFHQSAGRARRNVARLALCQ